MKVLIIGGTGLISQGIVKHLLVRGADITVYNRAQRENTLGPTVRTIVGDRNQFDEFRKTFSDLKFDVVIDMIGFTPEQAESAAKTFAGKCGQFIFCSTVCTYGIKLPPGIFIDETFPQEPISAYGKNKLLCERIFLDAHESRHLNATIIRPSCTYGEGNPLIDNLEGNPTTWDRVRRGLPVLCAGDGLGLWVATHRDDCGKLFAYAAMNPKTYGESFNATRDPHMTWREYYHDAAAALGKTAKVLFLPADWITKHDPQRFGLLREITAFHGAYSSHKAKRHVPEFKCEIDFKTGAKATFIDLERRKDWRDSSEDTLYQSMVDNAIKMGFEPVEV